MKGVSVEVKSQFQKRLLVHCGYWMHELDAMRRIERRDRNVVRQEEGRRVD